MRRILEKHLYAHIGFKEKRHSLNFGNILVVAILFVSTWFLAEYLVFQLNYLNKDFFGARLEARAVLGDDIPMPDINEVVLLDNLTDEDDELGDGDDFSPGNDSDNSDSNSSSNEADLKIYRDYFGGNVDTDKDGIPDSKEENIYKTDPKKTDTDSDGYFDGEEVYNSYSPLYKNITPDKKFSDKLKGKILLQAQERGEAWYIYPKDLKRYYLGRPLDAFDIMRYLGLGIRHSELENFLKEGFPSRLSGVILLDVEKHGEAYYVFPDDKRGRYLAKPEDAFKIMRELGLGIAFNDLVKISK